MKLYTEEQVRQAIDLAKVGKTTTLMWSEIKERDYSTDEILNSLTPIELPSDEEIEKKADEYVENKWEYAQDECKETFTDCAKWMKEQILNQNK